MKSGQKERSILRPSNNRFETLTSRMMNVGEGSRGEIRKDWKKEREEKGERERRN